MTRKPIVVTVLVTLTLILPAVAHAQRRGGGGHARSGATAGRVGVASPRVSAPRAIGARPSGYGAASRVAVPRYGVVRPYAAAQRGGIIVGRATPRVIAPRVIAPRVVGVAPYRFHQPYYVFRPRVSVGFGLWLGYPVTYPYGFIGYYGPYGYGYPYSTYGYAYPYPYPYPAPNPYLYPPSAYVTYPSPYVPPVNDVQPLPPAATNSGGVSFEITPDTAEIYVDGVYVGTVAQFTPTSQPLGVTPGRHHIELRAPGYQTIAFDADIVAGEVIPYQGAMQR